MTTMAVLLALGALAAAGDLQRSALDQPPRVTVRVTNCASRTIAVAIGPVSLCAEARVDRRDDHRWIQFEWDFEDRVGATALLGGPILPGADAPFPEDVEGAFGTPEALLRHREDGPIGRGGQALDWTRHQARVDRLMRDLSGGTYAVTVRVCGDIPTGANDCRRVLATARTVVTVR